MRRAARGNRAGQARPWARTGNLPVRYEQRNLTAQSSSNDMTHYGVSVCIEGGVDDQRGFTYGYGMALQTPPDLKTAAKTLRRAPWKPFWPEQVDALLTM